MYMYSTHSYLYSIYYSASLFTDTSIYLFYLYVINGLCEFVRSHFYARSLPLPGAETITKQLHVADTDLNAISSFWALKRRALSPESAPLLPYPPLAVAVRMAGSALGGVGSSAAARRMSRLAFRLLYLVHLRRHIERVRNMCYLLVRRERMRKRFLCLKRSVLDAQLKFSREHLPPASKGGAPVKQLTPPSSPVDGFKKPFSPAALKRLNSFQSLGLHMRSPSISDLESLSSAHLIAASSSGAHSDYKLQNRVVLL